MANLFPITGISWDKAWLLYLCFKIPFSFLYCSAARYSKRNGLQVMQRGFCCRTCLVWVRAVVKSYLTTFYVTNKSFFFVLSSLFKEFATEKLHPISIMSFFLYLRNFVAPLKTSYCKWSPHSGWNRNATIWTICVVHVLYEHTLLLFFFMLSRLLWAVRHLRSCGQSHSTPWGRDARLLSNVFQGLSLF